mgnify:CR=1 FL=1
MARKSKKKPTPPRLAKDETKDRIRKRMVVAPDETFDGLKAPKRIKV